MVTKNSEKTREMVMAALCLALALLLPFLTGQIKEIGNMLCPMHFPILLCGFVLGGPWGLFVQLEMGWRCGCGGTASSLLNLGNAADGSDYILYDI